MAGGLALSAALTPVPLLDGLTYEYALVVAAGGFLFAAALGGRIGASLALPHALRWKLLDPGPRARLDRGVRRAGTRLVAGAVAAAVLPALRGHALGCVFERGIPIYLLAVLPALGLGLSVGAWAGVWFPTSPGRRALAVGGFVAASAALTAYEIVAGPLAVFHNLVVGPVAATAYLGLDESVRIPLDQVLHRAAALLLAALLLALAVHRAAGRGRAALPAEAERVAILLAAERRLARRRALAAGLGVALLAAAGDRSGFGSGRGRLERRLTASAEAAGCRLRFRPASRMEGLAPVLVEDCEWALGRVRRALGLETTSGPPVVVWAYENAAEQASLTGASGYLFAKPWLGEVHTRLDAGGALVALEHELAHVVAGEIGIPGLRVSLRYGLIEGLAEAVAEDYARLDSRHEAAAAALRLGLLPRAGEALGNLGFARRTAPVSYHAAASFTGWLLRARGPERLRAVYARGDFRRAYGAGIEVLDREWREFLSRIAPGARAAAWAERAFDPVRSPPFFRRACARVGERPEAASEACCPDPPSPAVEERRVEAGLARLDAAIAHGSLPEREEAAYALALRLGELGRWEEAAAALGRRADLAEIAGRPAPLARAAAAEPALVPWVLVATGGLDRSALASRAFPPVSLDSGEAAVVRAAASVALDAAAATGDRELLGLGGCGAGLAETEARLLARASRAALLGGRRERALALASAAASLAWIGEEGRVMTERAVDRAAFTRGRSHFNGSKSR